MRTPLLTCLLLLLSPLCTRAGIATQHFIDTGGASRTYTLFVPSGVTKDKPAPVVFLFHGSGGTGQSMDRMSGFSAVAERGNFILVLPDALGHNWNDGREVPSIPSMARQVDDVGFVDAMIDDIAATQRVDSKRLFATGFSNGGIFVHLLAEKATHAFAAIAPVSGGIATPLADTFKPTAPVSVLIIHGTADPMVPYLGGDVDSHDNGSVISVEECARKWLACDGIKASSQLGILPDTDKDDHCTVSWERWTASDVHPVPEVTIFTLHGAGHTWASGPQFAPVMIIGHVCRDLDASEVIWDFFKKHPL